MVRKGRLSTPTAQPRTARLRGGPVDETDALAIADRLAEARVEPVSMGEIDSEVKPFVSSAGKVRAGVHTNVLRSG